MPEITEIAHSDDEFQDAISDQSGQKDSTDACAPDPKAEIEEIIKLQGDLHIGDEAASSGIVDNDTSPVSEYEQDEIDEEALKEKEESMTHEELETNKNRAHNLKLEANVLFKNSESKQAIDIYTEALLICPLCYNKERAVLYGNRAAAKIKLDYKKSALVDCSKAIELWPEYVRALVRRAKLYEHEDKLDEALADYKRVYELDPGQNDAREAMLRLPPLIDERNEHLKEEMMDKLKDLGNMILKPFGLSTSNFQMQKDPNTGSYSINFNQNSS